MIKMLYFICGLSPYLVIYFKGWFVTSSTCPTWIIATLAKAKISLRKLLSTNPITSYHIYSMNINPKTKQTQKCSLVIEQYAPNSIQGPFT